MKPAELSAGGQPAVAESVNATPQPASGAGAQGITPPAVVVFDLGKVLLDFDYGIAARRVAMRSRILPADVQRWLDHSPLLFRFESGQMSREEFFKAVREATGFGGSQDEFEGFFADIFWEIPPMVGWQQRLRARGIPTFVLSNTNELAIKHIRRAFPFYANFDGYVLSYEVGCMKPDPAIYAALEERAGHRGAKIFYLDDRRENVEAALARGWRAVVHESPETSLAAGRAVGLPD